MTADWEERRLGELVATLQGFAFSSTQFSPNPADGLPLIRIRDLHVQRPDVFIRGEYPQAYVVVNGDLLVGMDGDFEASRWRMVPALLNQRVCKLSPANPQLLDRGFLFFRIQPELLAIHAGIGRTTVKHLSAKHLTARCILLPPVSEQRKIAAILSSVDDAIEATQAVIDQLQVVKKAMMAELLTRGLPGRHRKFKITEIGEVPEEWEVVALEELATKITDGEHQTPKRTSSGVLLLSARNVIDGELRLKDVDFIDEEEYERIAKRCRPEADDILISCSGTVGRVSRVPHGLRFGLVRSVALIKPRAGAVTSPFLEHCLRGELLQKQMDDTKKQAAQANLFQGAIRRLLIPLPSAKEQAGIAAILSSIDQRIRQEKMCLAEYATVKAALMSVLLTGEVRVKPDEAA